MSKFIIEVRTKGFGKAETELKRVSSQSRSFARQANKSADAGATFRREVSQLRNNMLLYTFAIGGAIAGMGRFIKAASDAREQASQFKIVFGDFAGEADAFATSIQNSFGIAKSEMVALLAGLQDTFVPLGFSREQASSLSQSIAQLSLDVGSFKNLATGDVANRFTSALIGNHEAVRSLGISLTEATIKQEALSLGIIQANQEMTQEAKILGRLSLVFKGTSDAQGDLLRTQDEFANRLRGTSGRLKQLQEDIGNALLPLGHFGLSMVNFMTNSRRMTHVLLGISAAFVAYAASAVKAAIATNTLSTAMRRNLIFGAITVGVVAIDALLEKFGFFGEELESTAPEVDNLGELVQELAKQNLDLSGGINDATKSAKNQTEALEKLTENIEKNEDALELRLALMHEENELGKAAATVFVNENRRLTQKEIALLKQIDAQIQANKEQREAIKIAEELAKLEKEAAERKLDQQGEIAQVQFEALLLQRELDGENSVQLEKMRVIESAAGEMAKALKMPYAEILPLISDYTSKLDVQTFTQIHNTETYKEHAQAIVEATNKKLDLIDKTEEERVSEEKSIQKKKDLAKTTQEQARASAIAASTILAMAGAIKSLGDESMDSDDKLRVMLQTIGGIASVIPGGQMLGAFLQAGSMFIGHTGGLVKNNGIQRFATGGMVQGEDNVPILAQAGEFIMRRSAVQNIGVENLAEMNRTGNSNSVTVNIQGNMIGNKSFVRDVMLPEIHKSMNRA